ncbi:MAG: TIGR00299 family protein [Desulfobacteraceae bacterium 4572_88]|nr:MAG: TIGR00299 family protein [Desulfobacteraceae bacterium 4572_88]
MKIAYFDCFAGASGDMILGALMDAGLDLESLKEELAKLRLSHFDLRKEKVHKKGISGTQAVVITEAEHEHRHLSHIEEIIGKSDLSASVKKKSIAIFRRLAEAEAKVHQTAVENIHFHEVGAMDAIIDVVGSVAGLDALGIEQTYCSPLHVGSGTVTCAHGTLPVPAPATAELTKGFPIYATGVRGELLTPTGAAILTTLSSGFGPMPAMISESVGYGAGNAEREIPNLLRVSIGETSDFPNGCATETVAVVETSIDDMNPQIWGYVTEKLLDMGVMDAFLSPLQMKKNRPGTLITVICSPEMVEKVAELLIRETTTIGVRWRMEQRIKAHRVIRTIPTQYGPIRFKMAQIGDEIVNLTPEYEDCKRVAIEKEIPLKQVMEEARSVASKYTEY